MKMTTKHRKTILRNAKKRPDWTSNEGVQDKIITEECVKKNFTLNEFYATDGKMLNKLLGI
jgi:hypothetical protein